MQTGTDEEWVLAWMWWLAWPSGAQHACLEIQLKALCSPGSCGKFANCVLLIGASEDASSLP